MPKQPHPSFLDDRQPDCARMWRNQARASREHLEKLLVRVAGWNLPGSEHAAAYFSHQHRRNRRPNTLEANFTAIKLFLSYIGKKGKTHLEECRRFGPPPTRIVMDEELNEMTREELIEEVRKLRLGIRKHRDGSVHELCWHHPELWGLLPEKTDPIPVVPEWPEFMKGCVKYRQSLDKQAPGAPRHMSLIMRSST